MNSYQDLKVWHKAKNVAVQTYHLCLLFPVEEKYGLSSQMKRCSISIASNIAEGKMRGGDKEFKRFLLIAFASGAELETQIQIAKEVLNIKHDEYMNLESILLETMKMLNKLIAKC